MRLPHPLPLAVVAGGCAAISYVATLALPYKMLTGQIKTELYALPAAMAASACLSAIHRASPQKKAGETAIEALADLVENLRKNDPVGAVNAASIALVSAKTKNKAVMETEIIADMAAKWEFGENEPVDVFRLEAMACEAMGILGKNTPPETGKWTVLANGKAVFEGRYREAARTLRTLVKSGQQAGMARTAE